MVPCSICTGAHRVASEPTSPAPLIPRAQLKINFFAWLQRNAGWNEFRLSGVDLDLVARCGRPLAVAGLGIERWRANAMRRQALFDLGTLVLRDLRLNIDDAPNERQFQLGADEVRLINNGDQHRVLGRVHNLETPSPPIDAVVRIQQR